MAQITITIPDAQVQRVRDAFTSILELDQPATAADIKQFLITDIKQVVRNAERRAAQQAAIDAAGPEPDLT